MRAGWAGVSRVAVVATLVVGLGAAGCAAPRPPQETVAAPAPRVATPAPIAPALGPTMTYAEAAARLRDRALAIAMPPHPSTATPAERARLLTAVVPALAPDDARVLGLLRETHRVLTGELADDLKTGGWAEQLSDLAAAWQARGDRDQALALLGLLVENEQMDALSARSLRLAATTFVQAGARAFGLAAIGERDEAAVALAEAQLGDVTWAERTAEDRGGPSGCAIFAAVARRHAREGRTEAAARALRRAVEKGENHAAESPEDRWARGTCLAQIARSQAAAGDDGGARALLATLAPGDVGGACAVLREVLREVDGDSFHDRVDVPVLIAASFDRDSVLSRQAGCPVALADVASRRHDQPLVRRLLRHWSDSEVAADWEDDPPSYPWEFRLRVGLQDPVAIDPADPDDPEELVRTELALARVLDETPGATLDRAPFEARFPADPHAAQATDDDHE